MREIVASKSKSFVNRALILASYQSDRNLLALEPYCTNTDTQELFQSLLKLKNQETSFFISEGATPFHFLVARLSREVGEFRITTHKTLARRPHESLFSALRKLGCDISLIDQTYTLKSNGWVKRENPIRVDCTLSSQYASALALNSYPLDYNDFFCFQNLSQSYFQMTLEAIKKSSDLLQILETDMSSAFSLVATLIWKEDFVLKNIPMESLQPDFIFIEIMQKMGFSLSLKNNDLIVCKMTQEVKPIQIDIAQAPDLLPVLSVLCALSKEESIITGISRNLYKESNRVEEVEKLLRFLNVKVVVSKDQIAIKGRPHIINPLEYDAPKDHRMVMAAAVFLANNFLTGISSQECVDKSYPLFWQDTGL